MDEELINEANSFAETDNAEILAARAAYKAAYEKFKPEVEREAALVCQAGGLFIVGTERHESRRIDNQLRGRSGRQGDPGETRFYLSMEDDVMEQPEGYAFCGELHRFFPDRLTASADHNVGYSPILVKKPQDYVITQQEYHTTTWEMVLPLTDDMAG